MIKSTEAPAKVEADIDRKIVDALEKVAQVLRNLSWKKSVEQSINPIQLQILVFLLHHQEHQARVSQLSREFNISKASISDTIKLLENKKLIEKVYDASGSGKFVIRLSAAGRRKASEVSLFDEVLLSGVSRIISADKEQLFFSLSQILLHLYDADVITHQRMCLTCKHYQAKGPLHYCNLLQQFMPVAQLRIDCPEHLANL